jgi:stress response protein YsnF
MIDSTGVNVQTVLATFDDEQAARKAAEELVVAGFSPAHVHLQSSTVPGVVMADEGPPGEARSAAGSGNRIMSTVGQFFSNLFGSEQERAGVYSEAVRRGSTVVAVNTQTDAEMDQAQAVFHRYGSINIDDRAARWKSEGWSGFDESAVPLGGNDRAAQQESLPVVEEQMHVGKRIVELGRLRVTKRVIETPISEVINLRQQNVTLERTSVDRPATEEDFQNFKEGVFEVRETAEEAVISKTARVVEEVVVRKVATNRTETISDTIRKTDVDVEHVLPSEEERVPTANPPSTSS